MNIERLSKMSAFLRALPPQQRDLFSLREWLQVDEAEGYAAGSTPNGELQDLTPPQLMEKALKCGYSACAIGWATMMPEFKAEGFGFEWHHSHFDGYTFRPHFEGEANWEAVQKFFGITYDHATELFSAYEYGLDADDITPEMVACRIDRLITTGRAKLPGDDE